MSYRESERSMKTKFVVLVAAALVSIFGAAACADQLRDEAEQRAREEVERQVEKGRQQVEEQIEKGRTEAEQRVAEELQKARQQAEER